MNFFLIIEKSINYRIVSLDIALLKIAEKIKGLEVHDRLITATAMLMNTPLISSDKDIHAKGW